MVALLSKPLLLKDSVEPDLQHVLVADGEAVLCSFRAPDKDGSNEDSAAIVPLDRHAVILAVADGVGGSRLAHTASQDTVDALAGIPADNDRGSSSRAAIVNAIEHANESVRASGNGSATTLALVEIDRHRVRPIHIGDSAVMVVGQRGRLRLQTVAHSPVGYAVEAGVMDEGEAMHHEDRHLVSNVIGARDMRIEIGQSLALARRDTVVLATDGVLDNLHPDELIEYVRVGNIEKAAERVMKAAQQRMLEPEAAAPSKPDDTTLVLYRRSC
ncbi:MAG: protein phosphatase 2C domain-containing protein [Gammaproteobacteria bacterium]|nr:protein phosphatase 2C domain-containing protein [Gammaproteobacteria bacterium]NNF59918.1 SpoIIE family protein phosphatase [Gammaproteobacteria bacterium]NNM21652.1 SpoIIE family protein phosphatase [Gammaproteobacteria bacterium]